MALIADVVAGTTISATWGNNIRNATVQVTTSGARPTGAEGSVIGETDTDYLMVHNGSAWKYILNYGVWTSYNPTWAGAVTVGNGTATGAHTHVGNLWFFRAKFVLGSTSSIGSAAATVTLPGTFSSSTPLLDCTARFYDTSAAKWWLAGVDSSTTVVSLYQVNTSAINNRFDNVSSTAPFTWATGDELHICGFGETS